MIIIHGRESWCPLLVGKDDLNEIVKIQAICCSRCNRKYKMKWFYRLWVPRIGLYYLLPFVGNDNDFILAKKTSARRKIRLTQSTSKLILLIYRAFTFLSRIQGRNALRICIMQSGFDSFFWCKQSYNCEKHKSF